MKDDDDDTKQTPKMAGAQVLRQESGESKFLAFNILRGVRRSRTAVVLGFS